ncbi:TraR/DksA family transcriptional regulator [Bdellovibrio sp. HCB337]|uniref:TraR/DksA family transcriptional regulator n=1 Tax=Bdellovibrio sp. HCB337 TaxID=3394358 RepID=UPI0039A64D0A
MNSTELSAIRESLLSLKGAILNKTNEFKQEQSLAVTVSDEAEAASIDISNNISIHLHERDRNSLFMIERALGKISDGTYGQCECCAGTIGIRRLQARPFTTMCIECMEDQEDLRNSYHQ